MNTSFFIRFRDNWKENYAVTVVYGYMYDIIVWPLLFWGTTLLTEFTGRQWPGPPLVPWEQLAVASANLAVIGGVQLLKTREANRQTPATVIESSVEKTVETKTKRGK